MRCHLNHHGYGRFHHNSFIAKDMERKHKTHNTTGPEAPRSRNPNASNSIGPDFDLRIVTTHNAKIAAIGKPTTAAKWFLKISSERTWMEIEIHLWPTPVAPFGSSKASHWAMIKYRNNTGARYRARNAIILEADFSLWSDFLRSFSGLSVISCSIKL